MFGIKVAGNRKLRNRLVGVADFLQSPWVKYLGIPIVFVGPLSLVFLYYTEPVAKNWLISVLPKFVISSLDNNAGTIFFASILLVFVLDATPKLINAVANNPAENVNARGLLSLKESLEKVVSAKEQRFAHEAQEFIAGRINKEDVFDRITQPDQQIATIVSLLYEFLNTITDDIDFKVRLVKIDNGIPTAWFCHAPQNRTPRTGIETLANPESCVMSCIRSRKIEVVEDIQAEAQKPRDRKYVFGHVDRGQEIGSLLCYPIFHAPSNCYPYVLTISADKFYFKPKKEELYRWILDQFALRIRLEHSLLILKQGE